MLLLFGLSGFKLPDRNALEALSPASSAYRRQDCMQV